VVHGNAPLSEVGRLRLARCVVEEGWPLRRAAERFQVSATTTARWSGRYRDFGVAGMVDRSSRPHRSPHRTPTRTERRIIKVRVIRRWGPARIGYLLGIHPSTVHRVLTRYGLAKLRWLDRPTGRVIRRINTVRCGDLVHIDVKKLGKIPAGGGWRMLGRTEGNYNARADKSSGLFNAYIPPSTGIPAWPTASSSAMNAKIPPPPSGPAPIPGSPSAASRSETC
jgi:transposase